VNKKPQKIDYSKFDYLMVPDSMAKALEHEGKQLPFSILILKIDITKSSKPNMALIERFSTTLN
jgi:hypothetical protein